VKTPIQLARGALEIVAGAAHALAQRAREDAHERQVGDEHPGRGQHGGARLDRAAAQPLADPRQGHERGARGGGGEQAARQAVQEPARDHDQREEQRELAVAATGQGGEHAHQHQVGDHLQVGLEGEPAADADSGPEQRRGRAHRDQGPEHHAPRPRRGLGTQQHPDRKRQGHHQESRADEGPEPLPLVGPRAVLARGHARDRDAVQQSHQ